MSSVISSSHAETLHLPGRCKVISVLVNDPSADGDKVSLFDYQDTGGRPQIIVSGLANTPNQVTFKGIEFPNGFSVVPTAAMGFYLVEYERLSNAQSE